ncbi:rhomboid family intramembrane serine protease [Vaginella massiliensis]|uniref:rhomboid family intramembrane serine protease n=1 Tax=Vaginella massiliensis TaxID=1816680 RepID=UPI000838332B|nr:rhomboid family intramembrane serine protease [Vaginella massiliensis]
MNNFPLIVLVIIAVNAVVSMRGFSDLAFFEKYKFNVARIQNQKEYHRLLTSGFLHVNYTHLIFNMLTLYFFSGIVVSFFGNPLVVFGDTSFMNQNLGSILFLVLYLLSIVAGNVLALFEHRNQPNYSAVGASGGVSGVLFSAIAVYPTLMLGIFFVIPMPAWIFAIVYLGFSVYGMRNNLGNLGHAAHLGGSIFGLLGTILYFPELLQINRFYIILMCLPIVALMLMMLFNKNKA